MPWAGTQRFLASHDVATGAVGVLLFFLVSGFVIPFSLDHGRLRGFAVRRFFRLYPTLWVCLAVTVTALLVQGAVLGGVRPGSPLLWVGFNAAFANVILAGVVLHQLYRGRWTAARGRGDVRGRVRRLRGQPPPQPTAVVSGVYATSSMVAVAVFGALFLARDRLPYSRVVDGLSNISYPLYLLHGVNGYVLIPAVHLATGSYYGGLVAALAVTVAVATAVHVLVETPTNNLGRRLANRRDPIVPPVEVGYVAVAGDLRP